MFRTVASDKLRKYKGNLLRSPEAPTIVFLTVDERSGKSSSDGLFREATIIAAPPQPEARPTEENIARDPNEPQSAEIARARAIKEAPGYVIDTIKFFDDQERKQILDRVLSELDSKLVVQRAE